MKKKKKIKVKTILSTLSLSVLILIIAYLIIFMMILPFIQNILPAKTYTFTGKILDKEITTTQTQYGPNFYYYLLIEDENKVSFYYNTNQASYHSLNKNDKVHVIYFKYWFSNKREIKSIKK